MDIVSRAQWGARAPKSRVSGDTVTETYLHHTAGAHSGAAGMRSIQTFHMDRRGWADIAYNFLVDPDTLTVYEGRGWGVRPGSQKSHNRGTWSVCVMGNFQTETPPVGLAGLVADLIVYGHEHGHLPLELTGGHRDAPGQSTSCPGVNLYREIPTIRQLLVNQPEDPMSLPIDADSHKEQIRHVQEMLDVDASGAWDFVDALKLLAARSGTGDPRGRSGLHVNGRMYTQLLAEFIGRQGGGGAHDHDGRYVRDVSVIR